MSRVVLRPCRLEVHVILLRGVVSHAACSMRLGRGFLWGTWHFGVSYRTAHLFAFCGFHFLYVFKIRAASPLYTVVDVAVVVYGVVVSFILFIYKIVIVVG